MKRILTVGVLAAVLAATAQGQNSGLTAAGSNFTGPGGGGGGASGTIGAFVPTTVTQTLFGANGLPSTVTGPTNVRVGSVTVAVDAASRNAVTAAVAGGNATAFVTAIAGVPATQAQALGVALTSLGSAIQAYLTGSDRSYNSPNLVAARGALGTAITRLNDAINAMPAGTPVPSALIAARALIFSYYAG